MTDAEGRQLKKDFASSALANQQNRLRTQTLAYSAAAMRHEPGANFQIDAL